MDFPPWHHPTSLSRRGIILCQLRYGNTEVMSMFPIRRVLFLMLSASSLFAQVEPQAGTWKTWVLSAGNQMRVPAPPAGGDSAAELQWLKDFMNSNAASDAGRAQIAYWDA